MPPIKVHLNDPITPTKADGVTPQTAQQAAAQPGDGATTTQEQSPYPAAAPGAAAVPAPTPYVPVPNIQPQATPTRTTNGTNYAPPPPQPGAVPVPFGQQASAPATSTLPPPPKAGEAAQRQGSVTTMPPQMGVPPPQQNFTPTRSTYNPPEANQGGPTTVNFGAAPGPQTFAGSHPPGYHQNVNAQEMSSAARASLDATERREGFNQTGLLSGIGGDSANDTAGNMWNTVKGWATAAGNTLAETEKEVWKRINKDS